MMLTGQQCSELTLAFSNRISLLDSYWEFLWTLLLSPSSSHPTGQRLDFHQLADYHVSHTALGKIAGYASHYSYSKSTFE